MTSFTKILMRATFAICCSVALLCGVCSNEFHMNVEVAATDCHILALLRTSRKGHNLFFNQAPGAYGKVDGYNFREGVGVTCRKRVMATMNLPA